MNWETDALCGPTGADWRVPVSETEARQELTRAALADAGLPGLLIHNPVDLYWLTGTRQDGCFHIPSAESESEPVQFIRRSLDRGIFEAGGDDAPHEVVSHPRAKTLDAELLRRGVTAAPALQLGYLPYSQANFWSAVLSSLDAGVEGGSGRREPLDGTSITHSLREVKSEWELERMREAGDVQLRMFETIAECGGDGKTELELAAAADAVSREAGFGGHIRMRRWPMDCDRVVIAAGRSGAVPSYFDAAVGATGPHPLAGLGAGFNKVRTGEPVLVDIVHVHRGYVSDCTRMFSAGPLNGEWKQRLDDMYTVSEAVVSALGAGQTCELAWESGVGLAAELGHADHLMGMLPEQARFLGHSIGLELDETPVLARGFDQPLEVGGTMAIEPKVIHPEGAIGIEDAWVRTAEGMVCLTAGERFPALTEW